MLPLAKTHSVRVLGPQPHYTAQGQWDRGLVDRPGYGLWTGLCRLCLGSAPGDMCPLLAGPQSSERQAPVYRLMWPC